MNTYKHYTDITKPLLDEIKVGDLIRVNDQKKPMRVNSVSENYFVMTQNNFGEIYYSVVEKKPWTEGGISRNKMAGGMFHCGTDNVIGGCATMPHYFENESIAYEYLERFECGYFELSVRTSIPIHHLYVKR